MPSAPADTSAPVTESAPATSTPAPDPFTTNNNGFSLFMNPTVGNAHVVVDFRTTWFPEETVSNQNTNLGYLQQNFSLSFPLWQDHTDELTGFTHVRGEFFQTHAILPDTGQPFPDDLWNIRVGSSYRHLFDNGWIAGGSVSVGSASDQPFSTFNEVIASVDAFLRIPQGEHNAWLFSLAYSPTGELAFPVPGVAFVWQPSEQFRAYIGLPFQIMYRPIDDLTLDFSYMLLQTVHARATYRLCQPVRIFAGFDWQNESYFLADRPTEDDRFFYYDKRVTGGVRTILTRHVSLEFAGGYEFDRFYFEGRHFSDRNFNRIDLADGPFASFQCQVRW
jgi:hypothetical protein